LRDGNVRQTAELKNGDFARKETNCNETQFKLNQIFNYVHKWN